jgi:hypothetical protein
MKYPPVLGENEKNKQRIIINKLMGLTKDKFKTPKSKNV